MRLDGQCEWNRGGLAFRPNKTARAGSMIEYVEACHEPTKTTGAPWCEAHRCEVKGCDNARVRGAVCVGHMPGSLRMAREARLAAPEPGA